MNSLRILWIFVVMTWATSFVFAADPPKKTVADTLQDRSLDSTKNHSFGNIDIFGQSAVGSIYVLWNNVDVNIEVKKTIQEKSFATDEFFMQNIDREQFEQERLLRLFEDRKTEFFKLFPEMKDDPDEED